MRRKMWIGAVALLLGSILHAQDIAGDWQGTLKAGRQELRTIIHIEKAENGGWKATMYSIDQTTDAITVTSLTLNRFNPKFAVDAVRGRYGRKDGPDGGSIYGNWTQRQALP